MITLYSLRVSILLLLLCLSSVSSLAQRQPAACSQATFAAFRRLPELNYECGQELNESDDAVLKLPQRLAGLSRLAGELESFTNAAWWQASVDDLNACEMHREIGALDAEEQASLARGDYAISLFGNHSLRLVMVTDPCYQTGYHGSVAYLLYREADRVFATLVLDGNYSRVDNSVRFDFANLNGQPIIEVSTSNSMPPAVKNYYFVIDPKSHRAIPKLLFRVGRKLTNQISSALIVGEPKELGLPRNAQDMQIIRGNRMLPSFSSYAETFADAGPRLKRTVYRWNGRFYGPFESHAKRRPAGV